nr:hypothetical protein GCM10020093_095890 [Planobispora longispora]
MGRLRADPGSAVRPATSRAGTRLAPRARAAITMAAAARTMSLKMYWASSVGAPGNRSVKNRTYGAKNPAVAPIITTRPVFSSLPVTSVRPMKTSMPAITNWAA